MEWLSQWAAFPLLMVPFATSIVLVLGTPQAEPAFAFAWHNLVRRGSGRSADILAEQSHWPKIQ
jgi:hypothetical protein